MDESALSFFGRREGRARRRRALALRRLPAEHARAARVAARRDADAGGDGHRRGLGRAQRAECGRRALGHVCRRAQACGRSAGRHRRALSVTTRLVWLACAGAALASVTPPLSAQSAAPERPPPRTADGKPDLSGIWVATGAIMLFEGQEAFAAARAADAAAGRPPGNTGEAPPYKPEAEAQRQYFLSRQGLDDPMARCLLTGVPRINFRPLPFEIVQLPDRVIMLYEIHHAFRIIPTDGRPPPEDAEPSYLGESVAHWDGDTLVFDVTSFNTNTC